MTSEPNSASWLDDDEGGEVDLRKEFAASDSTNNIKAITSVPSLASRLGGFAIDPSDPSGEVAKQQPIPVPTTTPPSRPRPETSNNLFGKALAGVKSDRAPEPISTVPAPLPQPPVEPKGDRMRSQHDDDGWGGPPTTQHFTNGQTNGNNGHLQPQDGPQDEQSDAGMSADTGLISNDFQVEVKLVDQQADPNSPLYSVKSFEALPLHEDLLKGIYACGFKKPSKIQEKALPLLLNNPPRNLIGQSQSGTGKTAAFTLNMLSRVDPSNATPQALCLCPSRELARQTQEVVEKLGQFTPIKSALAVPGSWRRGEKIQAQILIGTPGTLTDMLSRGTRIFDPKEIRVLVLDEADEMLALQGLGDQTSRIKRMLPAGIQNVLFSATFPDAVQRFAESFAPEANKIFLRKEEVTVEAIKQLYLECDGEEQKYNALAALYDCMTIGQSIVFCKRKAVADRITQRLQEEGHQVASLHGDKQNQERDQILDSFRNGETKVLITTNVVARGIDIQQVNMVVNYDVPDLGPEGNFEPDIETYIHRIGRTGRFGRKGCAVIFVHDERSRREVATIQDALGKSMRRIDATSTTDLEQLEEALKIAMKSVN
ncbi:hypothetical protein TREMEDRAFT_72673 [Tremella mesenterica DSM 1558]|uniref:uncharacterized protein n=1 Tax=Tremella mesenterica (strain ATCC 24925 / CBS 8224 / DSM 1558 / NBRC 9311 / NRRL Y-6157 / RJB 2259-6 / UBC 559-6) TaxID=578456 RepID=UPI0003F490C8|nr:uncharacterized protein TREMEDRAFT_72673 [Tremella mesenterica DSM 1558]EIW72168.1 hypothetical protein TREMEDRAFT_72673 [Tremella mesenterica DSM 1558]